MEIFKLQSPITINYSDSNKVYDQVVVTTYMESYGIKPLALILGREHDYIKVSTNLFQQKGAEIVVNTLNTYEYQAAVELEKQGVISSLNVPNTSSGWNVDAYKYYIINEKYLSDFQKNNEN